MGGHKLEVRFDAMGVDWFRSIWFRAGLDSRCDCRPWLCVMEQKTNFHQFEQIIKTTYLGQCFGVELVVAQVQRGVDCPEWLKIDVDLFLLALVSEDRAAVHLRHFISKHWVG